MTPDHAIEVDALSRRFGAFTAVDAVSFDVGRGEIFGYLGANGAGKSTTIRMLCGLLAPTSGDAVVAGARVSTSPEAVKRNIGYMSQRFSLYPELKVRENLEFFGGAYGLFGRHLNTRIAETLDRVGLHGHAEDRTSSLPGGMRQRVALAGAILHEPGIVFLDEPTAGVDPVARRRFWSLIRELASAGTTIFVTTHYMDEAEYCARVGLMVAGRLPALDTPEGLKATYVPGDLFVLRGPGAHADDARARLLAVPGVVDVATMGAGLRARCAADAHVRGDALAAALPAEVEVEPDTASLEDVFLAVVDAEAQARGAARAFGEGD
ncbi:MAG: ABC transporter ATP-binding protein [Alphaproteobacteria bacterium]|nr:ABC transporter ATP-binding protein [Alphaproteobacteria bacterium]